MNIDKQCKLINRQAGQGGRGRSKVEASFPENYVAPLTAAKSIPAIHVPRSSVIIGNGGRINI
ncbi:hypothetical protein DPV78_002216 [Talaromyces pinophilus]|nr:hypothetical protein DPV78_002216 [Talaromyces pinophilus]